MRGSHDTRVVKTPRPGFLIRTDLTPISAWMQGKFCYSCRRLLRYLRVAWPADRPRSFRMFQWAAQTRASAPITWNLHLKPLAHWIGRAERTHRMWCGIRRSLPARQHQKRGPPIDNIERMLAPLDPAVPRDARDGAHDRHLSILLLTAVRTTQVGTTAVRSSVVK